MTDKKPLVLRLPTDTLKRLDDEVERRNATAKTKTTRHALIVDFIEEGLLRPGLRAELKRLLQRKDLK